MFEKNARRNLTRKGERETDKRRIKDHKMYIATCKNE